MRASSSAESDGAYSASRFWSSWATLLAPTRAEVTTGRRSTHRSAICARVWPRACAISFSLRACSTFSGVTCSGRRKPWAFDARESVGMPAR